MEYFFKFSHRQFKKDDDPVFIFLEKSRRGRRVKAETKVTVKVKKDGAPNKDLQILCAGITHCVEGDVFIKEKGRRIALQHALSFIKDRETRRAIWHAYWKTKHYL